VIAHDLFCAHSLFPPPTTTIKPPVPKRLECCSGVDNPEEARYKAQFDLVFIDNGIGTPGCDFPFGGGTNTMLECHIHRSEGAARIKAIDSKKPVFVYRQISAVLEGANVTELAEAGLFIKWGARFDLI
jgi:hypothetical protein